MSDIPINKLTKKELVWLHRNKCKHSHRYLDHWTCYENEVLKGRDFKPGKERLPIYIRDGFFDIESTSLKANFGIMLCYCIKDGDSDKIYERVVNKKELDECLDREVVRQCVEDIQKFGRVITFYGSRFDLPFLRSRAVYWNIPFPKYQDICQTDVYYIVRNRFKLNRNSLESACNFLLPEEVQKKHEKTHYGRDHWLWAMQGKKESLDYIIEHCRHDVLMLEDLYYVVEDYARRTDISI